MQQAAKNMLAFGITLCVMGGGLGLGLIFNRAPEAVTEEELVPASAGVPWQEGEAIGLLLFGCEERTDEPESYCQLVFTGTPAVCTVYVLDGQEEVMTNAGTMTLSDCYTWGGMESAADGVAELYGLTDAYYLRIDRTQMETLLPPLSYGGEVLEGETLADGLLTPSRCGGIWAEICQTMLCPESVYHLDAFYDDFSMCDTDLTRGIFYGENRRIVAYLNQTPQIVLYDETQS